MRKYDETKKLKVLGINVDNNSIYVKYILNTDKAIMKEIGCSEFHSESFTLNGKTYRIICDQEGLCRINPKPSVVSYNGEPMIVGNIIIVRDKDDWSEFVSLDMSDIRDLMNYIDFNEDLGYHVFVYKERGEK